MSNDKAPGITGITPAFYKVFWDKIGDLVTEAMNSCQENHSLPPKAKNRPCDPNPQARQRPKTY